MDLEQQDEDLDEAIPANRPVTEARPRNGAEAGGSAINNDEAQPGEFGAAAGEELEASSAAAPGTAPALPATFADAGVAVDVAENAVGAASARRAARLEAKSATTFATESSADFSSEPVTEPRPEPRTDSRNERSSRGDRAGRDSRFQRPTPAARTGRDYDYGPPPGYQPIVLPASRFQNTNARGWARVRLKARLRRRKFHPLGRSVSSSIQRISRRMSRSLPATGLRRFRRGCRAASRT